MRNYCVFCGNKLVGGYCRCAEYVSYYGAPSAPEKPVINVTPKETPPAPKKLVINVTPKGTPSVPEKKSGDAHFQSAGDL